jgi:hypothetical protein
MNVSIGRLNEVLSYDSESGRLFWRKDQRGGFKRSVMIHAAGDEAGCSRADGRRVVRVDGRLLMAYRVAWALHSGQWPEGEIDHINGDHSDDRIANLREVSRRVNQQNIRAAHAGKKTSRYLGVYRNKPGRSKPWRAAIQAGGRQVYIGTFASEADAYAAYVEAKRRLHKGCTL